jgi:hypothetical protein
VAQKRDLEGKFTEHNEVIVRIPNAFPGKYATYESHHVHHIDYSYPYEALQVVNPVAYHRLNYDQDDTEHVTKTL